MEISEMRKPEKGQKHTILSMIKTLCCITWPAREKGKCRGRTLATTPWRKHSGVPERTCLRNRSFGSLYKALNYVSSGYLLYLKKILTED